MKSNSSVLIVISAIILSLLVSCVSNSGGAALYAKKDGSYNWAPQRLVDELNEEIQNTGDSRYLQIPNYVASGEKIEIDSSLNLIITQNDDGLITSIVVNWCTFALSTECFNTILIIIGRLLGTIAPNDAEQINLRLDIGASGTPEYTTSAEANGTFFKYEYTVNGMYQKLTISPAK